MVTPPKVGGSVDRTKINIHDDYEVKYWVQVFDITETQLKTAVKAVGNNTADVSKHLKK